MSSQRTIAFIGHNGTIGKPLLQALALQGNVKLRVLHRASSDISSIPNGVEAIQVDFADMAALTKALQGIDIVTSCIGGKTPEPYLTQLALIDAAVAAKVAYFLPSNFGPAYTAEEAATFVVASSKAQVVRKLAESNIKYINVHASAFAEFAFNYTILGIDVKENTLKVPGRNNKNLIEFNSIGYIVKTLAALTASDLSLYANKSIRFVEFAGNADTLSAAMSKKHDKITNVTHTPDEVVLEFFESSKGTPAAFIAAATHAWFTRGVIGAGEVFDGGVQRQTLDEFLQNV